MYYYSLYGCSIASSMEFPQLIQNRTSEIDIFISEGSIPIEILKESSLRYYDIGEMVSWFQNDMGIFYIKEGREIHYILKENVNIQYIRSYILGYAISMALLQRGIMTIHCSAVANNEGSILISGQSGAGKSTLTTSYLKHGYKFLADDIVAIRLNEENKVIAYPAFPYQKLCRDVVNNEELDLNNLIYIDEEKDKFLVPNKERFMKEPAEVKGMVILCPFDGMKLEIEEVKGINKLMAIRENLFLSPLRGSWIVKPLLIQTCLSIGSKVPIYVVRRPRKINTSAILKDEIDQVLSTAIMAQ